MNFQSELNQRNLSCSSLNIQRIIASIGKVTFRKKTNKQKSFAWGISEYGRTLWSGAKQNWNVEKTRKEHRIYTIFVAVACTTEARRKWHTIEMEWIEREREGSLGVPCNRAAGTVFSEYQQSTNMWGFGLAQWIWV